MRLLFDRYSVFRAARSACIFLFSALRRPFVPQPVLASDAVFVERVCRCYDCDRFHWDTGQCIKCTCFVKLKARIAAEQCADRAAPRWGRQTRFSTGL